jgi:hypothetical protein
MKNHSSIIAIFVAITLVMVNAVFPGDKNDIKGWGQTRWGMTESEIKLIFKDNIEELDRYNVDKDTYRNMQILKYDVDGNEFKVLFEMGEKDNKLRRVRMVKSPALPSTYGTLEQLLSVKYGDPTSKDESNFQGTLTKTSMWIMKSTSIELLFSYTRGLGSVINIIYSDREINKNALDKI